VKFDLLNNGHIEQTGWIAEGEGLLMRATSSHPILENGGQLFGQGTTLANGEKAVNGYQALAALDTNSDGVINNQDTAFNELGVWVDMANVNGVATGQFETLGQLGINQLNLNPEVSTQTNNGNLVGLISSFQTTSGATHVMADVWFSARVIPGSQATVITSTAPTGIFNNQTQHLLTALSQFNSNGQSISSQSYSAGQIATPVHTSSFSTIPPTLAIPFTKKSS
jgi:hypothetical protein